MDAAALTEQEKNCLLQIARQALEQAVDQSKPAAHMVQSSSVRLQEPGASFVTLTVNGSLRGCIGALEPYQPLIDDVREHAMAAATQDYRFPPVTPQELAGIRIEVSRLTQPVPLEYSDAEDLLKKIRPQIDGVVIRDGIRRATFLPQVWEKIADPAEFLEHLCLKLGAAPDLWQQKHLDILVYQVEEFRETQ
jgi:AmmeMemoRadiSam system protein A